MAFNIAKASGVHEEFNIDKLKKSLEKSGVSLHLIQDIAKKVQEVPKLTSTKDIYNFIIQYLKDTDRASAARYNIKYALMELGPAGYPFEKFVSEIFKAQGYKIEMNKRIDGLCVDYEIDFIAHQNNEKIIAECKFHNRRGLKSDVKDTLYVKARFDDIKNKNKKDKEEYKALIITNTRFTSKAIKYGKCVGLHLLDWSNPPQNPLPKLINKFGLYPITTLTSLNRKQKRLLIKNGLVLCNQIEKNKGLLDHLGLTKHQIKKVINEANNVCRSMD